MKLKWDQGLASRGKLKGLTTFADGVEEKQPRSTARKHKVQIKFATPRHTRKRKRIDVDEDIEEIPRIESPKRADVMTLATMAPEVPFMSIYPSAPIPEILRHGDNRRLFNYYLNHVCRVTVVTDTSQNPFRTTLCPMSFESPLIMSSVLAIASANLSHTDPQYRVLSYKHLNDALVGLKDRFWNPKTALSEITLAGVLAQVSCQLHHGNVNDWRIHLTAARGIVNALGGPRAVLKARPNWKFYIQHLAWLDTLAGTTYSTTKAGKSEYWDALLESIRSSKTSYGMRDLMGCPEDLLEIIADMTRHFDEQMEGLKWNCSSEVNRKLLGDQYSAELESLKPQRAPSDASSALTELFRISALIYLKYRIIGISCNSDELQELLRKGIGLLALVPLRSQEEMALPWPIFILGSVCIHGKEQRIIRARYHEMTRFMGFGNIERCAALLEEVWASRNDTSNYIKEKRPLWDDLMIHSGDLLLA